MRNIVMRECDGTATVRAQLGWGRRMSLSTRPVACIASKCAAALGLLLATVWNAFPLPGYDTGGAFARERRPLRSTAEVLR